MRTITTITTCALLALALATACTPHAADDPAAAHPVPLMPTATLAQATTAQPTRTAVVSRLSSSSEVALPRETGEYGGGEYPDRGEVVGKATRTTPASVPITLTGGTLNLTMNDVKNPYTLSANGALTSTTPHSVIGAGLRTFVVDEAKVTAATTTTTAPLPMNLGVAMPSTSLTVAADGAVTLPLVHTTAGMRLVLKMDDGVAPTSVACNSTGEVAPSINSADAATANTASRIVTLDASSSPSIYAVAFGMLTANTDIKAGDLLAMIDITTADAGVTTPTTKTLALIAPAPLQLLAGQMVTYTVHVGHSVASITSVGITEFEPGNGEGDDIGVGDERVVMADGTKALDHKIFNEKNPVWVITGDGDNEAADKVILGNVATVLNPGQGSVPGLIVPTPAKGSIHLIMPNFAGSIGVRAFGMRYALASVNMPLATTIGENAFNNCNGLTSVSLPGVTGTIGNSAFEGCAALTSVSLPGVTGAIGNSAFEGCAALTSVSLPGVTGIGGYAFAGCTALKRLELTQSTEKMTVYKDAFGLNVTELPNTTLVLNKSVEGNTEATIGVKIEEITDPSDPNVGKKKVTFLNAADGTTTDATFIFAAVEYLSS